MVFHLVKETMVDFLSRSDQADDVNKEAPAASSPGCIKYECALVMSVFIAGSVRWKYPRIAAWRAR